MKAIYPNCIEGGKYGKEEFEEAFKKKIKNKKNLKRAF